MCKYLILQLFSAKKRVENQDYILIIVSSEFFVFARLPMGWVRTSFMDVLVLFNSMAEFLFCKVNVSTERKRDISFVNL